MQKKSIQRAIEMRDYAMMRQAYGVVGDNPAKKLLYAATENDFTKEDIRRELMRIVATMPDDAPQRPQDIVLKKKEVVRRPSEELTAPDEVQKLVFRRKRLYGRMNYLFGVLQSETDKQRRYEAAKELLDADDEIVETWRQTDYYDQHGVLPTPPKPVKIELSSMGLMELMKLRNNLRTYLSKHKHNEKRAQEVDAWREELEQVNGLIQKINEGDDGTIQLR